ncbi:MAG TPA: hypothetical protein VHN37_00070 [Actinomycetota bacterium]|nr:hypothetical protein [Actinomycetota bacterium]
MKRSISLKTWVAAVALASGVVAVVPSPASAACAIYPGTNEITIRIGSGDPLMRIEPTPSGLVGLCVEVSGTPTPTVDPDVTVDFPEGCSSPCFVIAWDGVSTAPVLVRVTVIVDNQPTTIERTLVGQEEGSFCINSGAPCP